MIIVIEGVSASGKTTLSRDLAADFIPEASPEDARRVSLAPSQAEGWAQVHSARWEKALSVEAAGGVAVVDTDPVKLHYTWCELRAGLISEEAWADAVEAHRQAFGQHSLGFADVVVLLDPPGQVVRQQKMSDETRRRGNFERHLSFRPWLIEWYRAYDKLEEGRVLRGSVTEVPRVRVRSPRSGTKLFDESLRCLDMTVRADSPADAI